MKMLFVLWFIWMKDVMKLRLWDAGNYEWISFKEWWFPEEYVTSRRHRTINLFFFILMCDTLLWQKLTLWNICIIDKHLHVHRLVLCLLNDTSSVAEDDCDWRIGKETVVARDFIGVTVMNKGSAGFSCCAQLELWNRVLLLRLVVSWLVKE